MLPIAPEDCAEIADIQALLRQVCDLLAPRVYEAVGQRGGRARSARKAAAARRNGRRGGRPRTAPRHASLELGACLALGKRPTSAKTAIVVRATIGPTPGTVSSRCTTSRRSFAFVPKVRSNVRTCSAAWRHTA
jgi:hypothetical protein